MRMAAAIKHSTPITVSVTWAKAFIPVKYRKKLWWLHLIGG